MKPIKRAYDIQIHKIENYNFSQTALEISWKEWEFTPPNPFATDNSLPPDPVHSSPPVSKNFVAVISNEFLHVAMPTDLEKMLYMLFDPVFRMDLPELNYHLHSWIRKSVHELEEYPKYTPASEPKNDYRLSVWSKELPGVNELVKNPMTDALSTLREVIINLNDRHKWTREQVADWIETLDIDTRFKVD